MITHSDTFDHDTPLRIGCVRLNVRDRQKVAGFYEDVLGLHRLDDRDNVVTLGTPTVPLLELAGDPALAARNPRDAGLFHTAFLLPSRADLGHWLAAAIARDIPLQGASDHLVSEALYLADPEGNGIEVHADHASAYWRNARGEIQMITAPMNVPGVLAAGAGTEWTGFPTGGFIGHVHLQIGDVAAATAFYRDVLGFDLTSGYSGAAFFGSGGYHHHFAGNIWNSRGAGQRPGGAAGLASVELIARAPAIRAAIIARARAAGVGVTADGAITTLTDPWGTSITLAV